MPPPTIIVMHCLCTQRPSCRPGAGRSNPSRLRGRTYFFIYGGKIDCDSECVWIAGLLNPASRRMLQSSYVVNLGKSHPSLACDLTPPYAIALLEIKQNHNYIVLINIFLVTLCKTSEKNVVVVIS